MHDRALAPGHEAHLVLIEMFEGRASEALVHAFAGRAKIGEVPHAKGRFSPLLAAVTAALSSSCSFAAGRTGLPVDRETTGSGGAPGTSSAISSTAASSTASSASTANSTSMASSTSAVTASSSTGQTVRRPFLVGATLRTAGLRARSDWLDDSIAEGGLDLDRATRAMLAEAWLKDAREEHASVAAFARFTMHLLSVGAPPDLVQGSQRASLDEIQHATACFSLARRYGGHALGPADLDLRAAVEPLSLIEIAVLAAEEGCVGETLGVAHAMEQERRCGDAFVRSVLKKLVRDEQRHARLAWAFTAWAVAEGGSDVERAVITAIERAISVTLEMPIRAYNGVDLAAWRSHGRLTCAEAREVVREATASVLAPAVGLLRCRKGTHREQLNQSLT